MPDGLIDAVVHVNGWRYENVADERRLKLLSPVSFDLLIEQLAANASISNVVLSEPFDGGATHDAPSHRVAFRLVGVKAVAFNAFDRLLNGAHGLRARYASSETAGARANEWFCRKLAQTIAAGKIAFADDVDKSSKATLRRQIEASMALSSANVWFDESVDQIAASTADGHVSCARWSQSRGNAIALPAELSRNARQLSLPQIMSLLDKGMTIPLVHAIDVKGGFRTRDGREFMAPGSRSRDLRIHLTGWA